MDPTKWLTHRKANRLVQTLGNEAAKAYIRAYFRNERLPTDPAERRLEFAHFFFPDALAEQSPEFHRDLLAEFLSGQNSANGAPRGHAKTTIGSAEVIARIVNAENHYTLVISDTYSQAKDIVDNIRGELESNDLIIWIYGSLRTEWHWTGGSFTTRNQVRVTARGSNMKVRGLKYRQWRPDFALIDDLENDEAVMKAERRLKLEKWVRMALMPAMAKKNSQIVMVGTVLHGDSLLNNALNGEKGFGGWRNNRWPALNQREDGSLYSLWPSMFPIEDLIRMRDDPSYEKYLGPIAFAQEMQNEAVDETSRIIKREWILGTDDRKNTYSLTQKETAWTASHPPGAKSWADTELKQIIMAIDPAISEKTTADYFAIFVIGVDAAGHIWELDKFRDRIGDIDKQVDVAIDYGIKWKVDKLKVESVAYQAGLARAIRKRAAERGVHLPVFEVKPDKDKFRRAVIHSANFAGGLVHLREDHPLFDQFVMELLNFPVGEHDDVFDAYMHAAEDLVQRPSVRTFARKPRGF